MKKVYSKNNNQDCVILLNPLVSIIILNYNGKRFLENCLVSVLQTNYPNFEVILIDNASTDGSLEFLSDFSPDSRVKVVRNKANMGYAGCNNKGIFLAKGNYVIFLNNDTLVKPDWLSELVKAMESDLSIGAAQSKLLLMDSPNRLDCAGNFTNFYGNTLVRGLNEEDVGKYMCDEIFSCKGASMIIRRCVLDKVGVFDSDYFAYYEDTDLCWRIQLAGYRIVFVPTSVVYHKGSGTIPTIGTSSMFFQVYLMKRNRIATLLKNYEIQNLIKFLSLSLIYECSQIILVGFDDLLNRRTLVYSKEASKAILWNLKHFPHTWKKRVFVQSLVRRMTDQYILCKMRVRK